MATIKSLEEKAKAYDEAIERAKFYKGLQAEMEFIFPELKEIEDEKIRKAIHICVENQNASYFAFDNISQEKCIAWLEKQGEQKPTNWVQEFEDKLANATPQQLAEWKEKYFKEEPTEWSEEDEKIILKMMFTFTTKVFPSSEECDSFIDFLKSLKPSWKPSDEQIDAIRYVANFDYGGYKATLVSLYEQLKKLREEKL